MKIWNRVVLIGILTGLSNPVLATLIYTPPKFNPSSAKMVVVIHGCLQSAESMALGTGWNQVADQNNLVVVYPQVPGGSNPIDCWSWFLPENQRADAGQLKMIVEEIESVRRILKLKKTDTYLAGISSGGAMVAGLLACFPRSFRAGAIHSGPSYALAQTLADADRVLKDGPPANSPQAPCRPRDFRGSILVIQGSKDVVVNPQHGPRVIFDFLGNLNSTSKRDHDTGENSYSVSEYSSPSGANGRLIVVSALGHAWSGFAKNLRRSTLLGPNGNFPTAVPFFSEIGPSATNLMWDFFSEVARKP